MSYGLNAPLRAKEKQWLIEAELTRGAAPRSAAEPVREWMRIAVRAPTEDAALQRADSHFGTPLSVRHIALDSAATLDEEAELLARLSDGAALVATPPRPARVAGAHLPDRLVVGSTAKPQLRSRPQDSGMDLLPDAVREAGGQVYAVLDGASVFGLAERLEGSGLAWKCLFQGEAAQIHAAAAPYLVALRPDNPLTAKLLRPLPDGREASPSSALQSGIFLASPVALEGVWRHLRKFTMLEDPARGGRVFFRFFDPLVFRTLVANLAPDDLAAFCRGISALAAVNAEGGFTTITRQDAAS